MALTKKRERSEALIQKADASDIYVKEARAGQKELGRSRKSLAAGHKLAAAARLQAEDSFKLRNELRACQ